MTPEQQVDIIREMTEALVKSFSYADDTPNGETLKDLHDRAEKLYQDSPHHEMKTFNRLNALYEERRRILEGV